MSTLTFTKLPQPVIYPDSDGKPMAENTLQFEWILKITEGVRHLFSDDPQVFVAGDLFWYPVEGHPEINVAPDTLVAFGRPPGHRGSYKQWEEAGVAPQVVFEVLSPGNRKREMADKLEFYRKYGVEEYYIYDPDPPTPHFTGYLRRGNKLAKIPKVHEFVSPRLKVKFELAREGDELTIVRPDGQPFITFEEMAFRADQACARAEDERDRADRERSRADQLQAELERLRRGL